MIATRQSPDQPAELVEAVRVQPSKSGQPVSHHTTGRSKVAAFATALCIFAATNLLLQKIIPTPTTPDLPGKTWSWWTMHNLTRIQTQPNVALLGSSLMVAAIAECDANFHHRSFDLAYYRGASYLESILARQFGGSFRTLNLSAPGQMPSDAYLTLKASIQRGVHPEVIFYGVAPRDFIDGTMQSPSDTEAFRVMHHVVNIDQVAADYFVTPVSKIDWLLSKISVLYRQAGPLQQKIRMASVDFTQNMLNQIAGKADRSYEPFAAYIKRGISPLDVEVGSFIASPTVAGTKMRDNTADYKQRYRNPSSDIYQTQLNFLDRIAQLCKENKIKLVLMQMPIMQQNIKLLNPKVYEKYQTDLAATAGKNGVPLIDLCKFDHYDVSDYRDTVHLNGFGGKKLVDHLVSELAAMNSLKLDMELASRAQTNRSIASSGPAGM